MSIFNDVKEENKKRVYTGSGIILTDKENNNFTVDVFFSNYDPEVPIIKIYNKSGTLALDSEYLNFLNSMMLALKEGKLEQFLTNLQEE